MDHRKRVSLYERPECSETRVNRKSTFISAGQTIADELGADVKRSQKRKSSESMSSSDSDENQENTPKRPSLELDRTPMKLYNNRRSVFSPLTPQSQASNTNQPDDSFDSIAFGQKYENGKEVDSNANSPPPSWKFGKTYVSKDFNKSDVMTSDSDENPTVD